MNRILDEAEYQKLLGDRQALIRAHHLIHAMVPYIGKMAVPGDFFADWNEHELYMGRYTTMTKSKNYKRTFKVKAGL